METIITHAAKSREGLSNLQHGETLCGKGLAPGGIHLVPSFYGRVLSVPTCKACRGILDSDRGTSEKYSPK